MAVIDKERRPPVIGEQLRSAREVLALSIEDVAEKLKIVPGELVSWEEGRSEPAFEHLWELADLYGRGVDYFLVRTAPMPQEVSFRVTKRRSFAEMPLEARKVLATFDELCRAATELSELSGEPRTIQIRQWKQPVDPELLAQSERERLGLDGKPVTNVRNLVEGQGVWVFELEVLGGEFSGFSWWHHTYGPCVLVNASDSRGRRTFTLAHELAHLLQPEPVFTPQPPPLCEVDLGSAIKEEREANKFAACFLMPKEDLVRQWRASGFLQKAPTVADLGPIARRYGVSLEALVWRLVDLALVDRDKADELLKTAEPKPFLRSPKVRVPTWRRRLGERYVSMAVRVHSQGKISLGKLAQYLQVSPYAVQQALEKEAGGAVKPEAGAQ